MINNSIIVQSAKFQEEFKDNKPFSHIVLDDFFEKEYANQLLLDFPEFEEKNALNELGRVGGKAVVQKIDAISPFYEGVYSYINSEKFLQTISSLTGIEKLIADPDMFGGGTHENVNGQELDTHVDFNYLNSSNLHRRLNLILYLNKDWDFIWGGIVELHSDPRNPFEDKITTITPMFNRCLIFETSEYSWHAFNKICLPEDQKERSRKSLFIYLYTKDRPAKEIVGPHATFYIQSPIPDHIKPGYTLKKDDTEELQRLLRRRDEYIEFYQKKEIEDGEKWQKTLDHLNRLQSKITLPLKGCVTQNGIAQNYWDDGWVGNNLETELETFETISQILIRGNMPENSPKGVTITVAIDDRPQGKFKVEEKSFEWLLKLSDPILKPFKLKITGDKWLNCKRDGISDDIRDLLFILGEIRFLTNGL